MGSIKEQNCAYCMIGQNDELVGAFGIPILDMGESNLILFKEQSHRGRCIVASKHHVDDISDLTDEQSAAYMADVRRVAAAVHKAFGPDKVNFGAYGDLMHHLHFHIVPKYHDDPFEWGDVFAMSPARTLLDEAEYKEIADKILSALEG